MLNKSECIQSIQYKFQLNFKRIEQSNKPSSTEFSSSAMMSEHKGYSSYKQDRAVCTIKSSTKFTTS